MFCKSVPAGENYTVWSPPASMPLCIPESSFVLSCVFMAECQGEGSSLGLWAPMQVTVPRGGSGHQTMSGQKQNVQAVHLLSSLLSDLRVGAQSSP